MDRLNFTIEWFHKENERQNSLNDSLNIPIGILTGVFALIFYMFTSFSFSKETNLIIEVSFVILIILTLACWIIVVYFLFRSYNNLFKNYEYKAIPFPTELDKQYERLENYINENRELLDTNITVDKLYEKQLAEMLSEYLNRNIENNDRKSWYLHLAKKFLLACIISVILCAIPFTIHFCSNKEVEQIQRVEINNLPTIPDKINNLNINTLKIENYERQRQGSTKADSSASTTSATTKANQGR
ncbi:MAG: hypothetical protein LDL38_10795 [Flavobacterium piscis]|nr:hypothetical protein [Flavobacterium piscis]